MTMKHAPSVLLITPPMVQVNTPYPATPVLTGFLKENGINAHQADFSLETALKLFSKKGVNDALNALSKKRLTDEKLKFFKMYGDKYIENVDDVVKFLQCRAPELSWRFSRRGLLPVNPALHEQDIDGNESDDDYLSEVFGIDSVNDTARYFASLFMDDLAEYFRLTLDSDFAFARYAEDISVAAPEFTPIINRLAVSPTYIDKIIDQLVSEAISKYKPDIIGVTVPFPGTVYGAFRIAAKTREFSPQTKLVLGGGYVNSELRDLTDERVFKYFDYISYDEGFAPWLGIVGLGPLVRTRTAGTAPEVLKDTSSSRMPKEKCKVRISDYEDLDLNRYISLTETTNPMQRLWSEGRWLKVQLASGCYWHKCRFCDVALDYIGNYSMPDAGQAVDAMVTMKNATGISAFHFTDEAIPPALLTKLCKEILARGENFTWWGNIRFDNTFDYNLACLMADAGCIAVTGGLECAQNRLLKLMNKGITCESARKACAAFSDAGIMVHAYLMYGYPSETAEETKEALDFVRGLFAEGNLHSAFWHRFALTVHSPLAADPIPGIKPVDNKEPICGRFAHNEIKYTEKINGVPSKKSLDKIGKALHLATYNFMQGRGLDLPVSFWFKN